MTHKQCAPCLRAGSHYVENVRAALNKISPRSTEFADVIISFAEEVVNKGVARHYASEADNTFFHKERWENYVSSLYVRDGTLVEKLYSVAPKKRLTAAGKKKANTKGFVPKDKDWETYNGVVKPVIDRSGIALSATEKISIDKFNKYLQEASKHFTYSGDFLDQNTRKREAQAYIDDLQRAAKATTEVIQRRKALIHSRIIATRLAVNDKEKRGPSQDEWSLGTEQELDTSVNPSKILAALENTFGKDMYTSLLGEPSGK
jgi:hypothetical protein